jgi:hypothetical protein
MNKNEEISIKPVQNGFKVNYEYRERMGNDLPDYNYMEEIYMFPSWNEVISFIQNKELEVPPAKI